MHANEATSRRHWERRRLVSLVYSRSALPFHGYCGTRSVMESCAMMSPNC
jgi:hypothetical protein